MTSVMLQRSDAFDRLLGKHIDLLTLAADVDPEYQNTRLRDSGQLGEHERIRNLWRELRDADAETLRRWFPNAASESVAFADANAAWQVDDPHGWRREYKNGDDVKQIRFYRTDGSLFAVDDRASGKRRMSVLDAKGEIIAQYTSIRDFYFSWFDLVIGTQPAVLINESKTVGAYVHDYRRPNVLICQVMHNSHLDNDASTPFGPLALGRMKMVETHDQVDIFAFLTSTQQDEFDEALGSEESHAVLPNSRQGSEVAEVAELERPRTAGIAVSSLDYRKRVDDAIRAVSLAADESGTPVTLDIFGAGKKKGQLQSLVDELGVSCAVRLRGYTHDARAEFRSHSFLLFTSRLEGMGLVLVEAMAEGCIPIAYDIRYGPAAVIDDGINGFLVPSGNKQALAGAIAKFVSMSDEQVVAMRRAAVRRAADFAEDAVVAQWKDTIDRAWIRKQRRLARPVRGDKVKIQGSPVITRNDETIEIDVTVKEGASVHERLVADVVTTDRRYSLRFHVDCVRDDSTVRCRVHIPIDTLIAPDDGNYEVFIRRAGSPLKTRTRVGSVAAAKVR